MCGICGQKHGTNEPHKVRDASERQYMTNTGTDFAAHARSKNQLKAMNLGLSRDKLLEQPMKKRVNTPSSDEAANLSMPVPKQFQQQMAKKEGVKLGRAPGVTEFYDYMHNSYSKNRL